MNAPLTLRRAEAIALLEGRGLRNRQARRALDGIEPMKHRLHTQSLWMRRDVEAFDVVDFLQRIGKDAAGSRDQTESGTIVP